MCVRCLSRSGQRPAPPSQYRTNAFTDGHIRQQLSIRPDRESAVYFTMMVCIGQVTGQATVLK
jgi:hypothetical protein